MSTAMSYKTKLARILSGEYLADCDSDHENADEPVKAQTSSESASTTSAPILNPQTNDVSSHAEPERLPFLIPPLDFTSDKAPIPNEQLPKEDGTDLEPPEVCMILGASDIPIDQPTFVKSSLNYNKPLPTLPSSQSSPWSLAYLPGKSKDFHHNMLQESNDVFGSSEVSKDKFEPPDGGAMAWLHVFAGHLVILNAQ